MYSINHITYSHPGLLDYSVRQLQRHDLQEWEKDLYIFILEWFSPGQYVSIYTSGSTGIPKEIRLSKEDMCKSAERSLVFFDIKPGENALLCLSVKYIAGMMMVVRAFTGRLNLVTVPPQHLQLTHPGDFHFAALVPLQLEKLTEEPQYLDNIKKLVIGGALLSSSLAKKLNASFHGKAWETYGMTETITHVAVREVTGTTPPLTFHALPGISFTIDERECLIIHDPLIHNRHIVTNDRIELLSSTSFRLLGRLDNVINSGGIKVQPEELENILSPYIQGKFCISSVPDDKLGNLVVLVVEKGTSLATLQEILDTIDPYHRPKKIIELAEFPLTSNGKTDQAVLKEKIRR